MFRFSFLRHLGREGALASGSGSLMPTERFGQTPDRTDVGEEIAALLAGRLVEHLVACKRSVPPWAAMNRLAHAAPGDLEHLLVGEDVPRGEGGWVRPWGSIERCVALRVLTCVQDHEEVARVQRDLLVPLELTLIEQHEATWVSLSEVFDSCLRVLDQHGLGQAS